MLNQRLKNLKSKLAVEKLDALLVSSVSNIVYLTGYSNFFKEERDGYLLITQKENYIFTHSIYSKSLEGKIPNFEDLEISRRESPEKLMRKFLKSSSMIGIEEHDLRVYEYKRLQKRFKNLKNFELRLHRSIKDKEEINLISKACKLTDEVFDKILKRIKVDISEKVLVYEIESLMKKGGLDSSFRTIVAFGVNTAYPHHQSGQDRLKNNQFVLIDFGVIFENYCSDMTRTVFFGTPSNKQKEIYETVLESQQKAVLFINNAIKNGKKIKAAAVDKVARDYIISKGYPSIPHSLGHGIGLEVHEQPYVSSKSKEELKMGMIFSIEPGIYIEGFGGVRIEDLYVVEKTGLRQITTFSKGLIEL